MREIVVVTNPEFSGEIRTTATYGDYVSPSQSLEVKNIVACGGKVLLDFGDMSVVTVPMEGTYLLDSSVSTWDSTHSTRLSRTEWDYVSVSKVDVILDGKLRMGYLASFEDTRGKFEKTFFRFIG